MFQLKWSLCQRTERWCGEGRSTTGWGRVWDRTDQPYREVLFTRHKSEASEGGSEVVGNPEDHSREALSGPSHSPAHSHAPPTHWQLTGQWWFETARVASLVPPNKNKAKHLEKQWYSLWSCSTEGNKITAVFPRSPKDTIPFVLLPEEQRRYKSIKHIQYIKSRRCFMFFKMFFFCCSFLIYWIAVEAVCSP